MKLLAVASLACSAAPASGELVAAAGSPVQFPSSRSAVRYQSDAVREDAAGAYLHVEALIRNLHYAKDVGVRASIDGSGWADVAGRHASMIDKELERWTIDVRPAGTWNRIEFAVYYKDLETGAQYWDNNGNRNYAVDAGALVHRVSDSIDGTTFLVDLDVRNAAYEKSCAAVLTTDGWLHQSWFPAAYVGAADRAGVERWRVAIDTAAPAPWGMSWGAAVYEYAVRCQVGDEQAWDNSNAANYRYERVPQPDITWETAFDGARALAVADDGATFVTSAGRWITGYRGDGAWAFAREMPAEVQGITWLDQAGVLLVQTGEGTGAAWRALARDGSDRWHTTARLRHLVRSTVGEFLAGEDGAAWARADGLQHSSPNGGCDGSSDNTGIVNAPNVSASGWVACRTPGKTVEVWNARTGATGASLPDGFVFAVTDAGEVVTLSADRSEATAWSAAGQKLWTRTGLVVAADTQYGFGAVCSNHASGGQVVIHHRDPVAPEGSFVAGIDVASGKESFHNAPVDYAMHPCAAADGNYYQTPMNEHYGRTSIVLTPTGKAARIDIGLNGKVFDIRPDGHMLRRSWAYYPSDAGRIVLTDSSVREEFSLSLQGSPGSYVAARSGQHLVIASPGKLRHYGF